MSSQLTLMHVIFCSFNNIDEGISFFNIFVYSCTEGDVRLVGGAHKFHGTVEICLDHFWCLVSQDDWDNLDAIVFWREFGGYNNSSGK